jgi:hypothetical protein
MRDYSPFEFDVKDITGIEPVYDFNKKESSVKGHFHIHMGKDSSFNLRFASVLNHKVTYDSNLFAFLMDNYSEKTLSEAVYDLYDMGFPIDEWVKDYLTYAIDKDDRFAAMLHIVSTLRKFNEDHSDEDDLLT